MNQINGYCQIELPDRISIKELNSAGVTLTDAEAKSIIKALNLDQVLAGDIAYANYINAWLNKPMIVKAHVAADEDTRDVKSIFHASTISMFSLADYLEIIFAYDDSENYRLVIISIYADGGEAGQIMKWHIAVKAKQITTTNIA